MTGIGGLDGAVLAFLVNFLAINEDRGRRFDADAHTISLYRNDRDAYLAIDDNFFAKPTGEDQHDKPPCSQMKPFTCFVP
jgi:hypothetical protein